MNTGLHISQLSYGRAGKDLISGLEWHLKPGQGLWVCGPNGSGKTSLLRVLAGLATPSKGKLFWQGRLLAEDRLTYQQALHFLGHQSGIKSKLTVRENLSYSQCLNDEMPTAPFQTILQQVHLAAEQNQLAQTLSAGQKRRLALARLLVTPKPLWILDEPFTNLDPIGQDWLNEKLEDHLAKQGLIILASHQPLKCHAANRFHMLSLPLLAKSKVPYV